ncbi:SulP family inorganic anion transporter [Archangium sp.]|uniref:SulP family inorganic anion transporter n=1 Tax=Archangium sp. TaxID=1872627 RepID=UPI00389A0146
MATSHSEVSDSKVDLSPLRNFRFDLPAGLVVFLVALPLCLGVALASGAPLLSGLIAGVVGGLFIPLVSRSPLSVCGPAAGLAAIVLAGIQQVGSFEAFAAVVVVSGVMQLGLGLSRAGGIVSFMPSSVIKGMLAAIGLLLILKQLPYALGMPGGKLSLSPSALSGIHPGALALGLGSLAVLILWDQYKPKRLAVVPSALLAVVVATLLNELFRRFAPSLALGTGYLVSLPVEGAASFIEQLRSPDWRVLGQGGAWVLAVTIAVVASLETLLSLEAVDRLDPHHRRTPLNRELVAQGLGNALSGLLGGLPVTSVIVRSSANVNAGARTRVSTMMHGALLLGAVVLAGELLRRIPLASLAAILLVTGYKLAKPALFRLMYGLGWNQFVPFVVTIGAILVTDLLKGIVVGLGVALAFILRNHLRAPYTLRHEGDRFVISLKGEVYFFNKAALLRALERLPEGAVVVVDGSAADFIDHDIVEALGSFGQAAPQRNIRLEVRDVGRTRVVAA